MTSASPAIVDSLPSTRTLPPESKVAVCWVRTWLSGAVMVQLPSRGSYNSALATPPPVTRTVPSFNRVAVCCARASCKSDVAIHEASGVIVQGSGVLRMKWFLHRSRSTLPRAIGLGERSAACDATDAASARKSAKEGTIGFMAALRRNLRPLWSDMPAPRSLAARNLSKFARFFGRYALAAGFPIGGVECLARLGAMPNRFRYSNANVVALPNPHR